MTDLFVTTVAVALDASARPAIQARMRELAEEGDTTTPEGRAAMFGAAIDALLAHAAAFTHGHSTQLAAPLDPARAHFTKAAADARARFPVEVIRNANGQISRQAPPELRETDAPGVVLVTVVAARRTPHEVPDVIDRATLTEALRALGKTTSAELVAMEVIWSPSEDRDRVDAAELLAELPEMRALEPAS